MTGPMSSRSSKSLLGIPPNGDAETQGASPQNARKNSGLGTI